jgi:hypothetical protein
MINYFQKGDKKQQAWIGKLRSLLETTDNIGRQIEHSKFVVYNLNVIFVCR